MSKITSRALSPMLRKACAWPIIWLENFLSAFESDVANEFKISYVVFTDGEFNVCRSIAKGPGYDFPHNQESVPWTHFTKPLSYSKDSSSDTIGNFVRKDPNNPTESVEYNLDTLVGNVDIKDNDAMPGINCNIHKIGTTERDILYRSRAQNEEYSDTDYITEIKEDNSIDLAMADRNHDFWAPWAWLETHDGLVAPNFYNLTNKTPLPIVYSPYNDTTFYTDKGLPDPTTADNEHAYVDTNSWRVETARIKDGLYEYDADGKRIEDDPKVLVGNDLMEKFIEYQLSSATRFRPSILFPGRIRTPRQNWTTDETSVVTNKTLFPLYDTWPESWQNLYNSDPTINSAYYYYRTTKTPVSRRWSSQLIGPNRDMGHFELQYEPGATFAQNNYIRYMEDMGGTGDGATQDVRSWTWENGDSYIDGYTEALHTSASGGDSWFIANPSEGGRPRRRRSRTFRIQELYPEYKIGEAFNPGSPAPAN